MKAEAAIALLLLLPACTPLPDSYPVPEQRSSPGGVEPEPLGAFVSMADPRAPDYLVEGFLQASPGQTWRWTNATPTVRARLSQTKNLRLAMQLAFPNQSHTSLLPIRVRILVNGRLLDTPVFRTAGLHEYKKPVPAEWLSTENENIVRCEIDPVYIAEADKAKLGMILSAIGFELQEP